MFACVAIFASQAGAVELDDDARAYLVANPVVSIGIIADNEPYSTITGAQPTGFSIDVLEELAARVGLSFDYRVGSWPEIYTAFKRGEIDAIDEISFSVERAESILFTDPYHYRETVVLHDSTRPLPALSSLSDLRGKRVGVVRDIFYKHVLLDHALEVAEYDGLPSLLQALAFGWIDAIVGPELTLRFLARKAGYSHVTVAGRVDMDGSELEDFRIGVSRDNPTLHRILAAGLAAIPAHRMDEMLQVWQEFGGRALSSTATFQLSEHHAAYVRRLGPVRVGIMRDYAPFSFVDGGSVQGLAVDILSRVQDLTGLQVIPVADRWQVLFDLFQRGEIDLIANISDNPARRDFTRFTAPYYVIPNVVFSRDAALRIDNIEDLRGLRVALGSGIFYETTVRAQLGENVLSFSSQDAMFRALAENSVDVVLAALPNGNHWIRELGLTDVRIAGELSIDGAAGEDLRFGVRPSLEPLAGIIDAALHAISPTERRTIENRWLGATTAMAKAPRPDALPDTGIGLSDEELGYLADRGNRVTVCVDPDWMPVEGLDRNGRVTGVSSGFLALFEGRLDWRLEVLPTRDWTETLDALRARRCDLVPLAMQTPERSEFLNFTTPYFVLPNVMLARMETPFIDSLDELDGRKIGVVKGYAFAELLRTRHPGLNLVDVDNEIDGLKRLQRGELHGYVSTLLTASHHLQELGLADIKVIGRVPGDWALSIASRNDEPLLQTITQKLVDSLTDPERRAVEDKWRTIRLEEHVDLSRLWMVLAGAGLVVLLLVLWNRKLGGLNRQLAEANARLAELSITDSLTGLGNRKYFDQHFDKTFRIAQRHQLRFAVAMIDIDHFKQINDTWGHRAGDDCLEVLADCLKTHARRETDRLARIGGEEFVFFTTCTDRDEIRDRLEQLRQAAAALRIPVEQQVIQLTISIGLALAVPQPGDKPDAALQQADAALYTAKREGRNRIAVARGKGMSAGDSHPQ